jgi:glycolate oxidase FAD binding subunit
VSAATACIEHVRELIGRRDTAERILPVAGASKPALSRPGAGVISVDVSDVRGIVEYDPAELTVTARAATPVTEVADALAEHDQYLPFDPPLVQAGATIGGVVAAATSGPNAFRHGGVRDFVIGVHLIDGTGRVVAGGGKVVKNAAGFDLPKLMVGSRGRLGVMTQLSFKVFPRPSATVTHCYDLGLELALPTIARLCRGPVALDAIDLEPGGRLVVRLGGDADGLQARSTRLSAELGAPGELLEGGVDRAYWADVARFSWVPDEWAIVRVPLAANLVPRADAALRAAGATVRYSLAGNLAWIAWPPGRGSDELASALDGLRLVGVALTGPPLPGPLGARSGGAFAERVRSAFDPFDRFVADQVH